MRAFAHRAIVGAITDQSSLVAKGRLIPRQRITRHYAIDQG